MKYTITEGRISQEKPTVVQINQSIESAIQKIRQQTAYIRTVTQKKNPKNENSLKYLWDNIKHNNICIIGVPKREEREQGTENLFEEILMGNFLNMVKKINI